jgi:hypothetical protein
MKNIGVEQMRGLCPQLVGKPGETPDAEQRVVMFADMRRQLQDLRIRKDAGQDCERHGHLDDLYSRRERSHVYRVTLSSWFGTQYILRCSVSPVPERLPPST